MMSLLRMALVLFAIGCGATTPSLTTGIGDPVRSEVDELRDDQVKALWSFDTHLSASGDRCDDLCTHHTRICTLATRICDISKSHPQHDRARVACETATDTCRDTNARLPEECWCRS